jgi:hypothetical protein
MPLAEIALATGFVDQSHLMNVLSPGDRLHPRGAPGDPGRGLDSAVRCY